MPQPFEGIRVIDLTHVLAGPFCAYQLAILGADTIKVEAPGEPDQVRMGGTDRHLNGQLMGTNYLAQAANKRSITLDLKSDKGRDVLKRLARGADVLIENYRADAMDALGIGYEAMREINPSLIYCSMTGYGRTGPKGRHTSYDNVVQAVSGLMSVSGTPDLTPLKVGAPVLDYASGTMAAFAVASALFQRQRTGEGQHIDFSMLDTALMLMSSTLTGYFHNGTVLSVPRGNDFPSPNGCCYKTADGLLMLAAFNHRQHERLWTALDRPDLAARSSYDEIEAGGETMKAELTRIFATRSAAEWEVFLNDRGVPAGRVLTIPEALEHDQVKARPALHVFENVPGVAGPVTVPVSGFAFAQDGPAARTPPPPMGAHTDEVLRDLGYGPEEVAALRDEGVI